MNENDNLEYNDGLGDMLREKERYEFSWSKTTIVLLIVVFGIFVGLTLAFNFSKNLLTDRPPTAPLVKVPAGKSYQEKVAAIEKEQNNLELIKKLEKSLAEADKKAAAIAQTNQPLVTTEKKTSSPHKKTTYFRVFEGSYDEIEKAKTKLKQMKEKGIDCFIKTTQIDDNVQYSIQVSAFTKREKAERHVQQLKKQGINPFIQVD